RRFMYVPVLLLLILGIAAVSAGAWYGGEMVYRSGVDVAADAPLAQIKDRGGALANVEINISEEPGVQFVTTSPATASATTITTAPSDARRRLKYYLPPMQTHVILAGFTVAMAMAALAASFRRANVLNDVDRNYPPRPDDLSDFTAAFGARPATPSLDPSGRPERFSRPGIPEDDLDDSVPGARFWMLAFLLALLTAACGAWMFLSGIGVPLADLPRDLQVIWRDDIFAHRRRLLHVLSGVAIIVLPLILAMIARWAPRQRWAMFLIALWLLSAVALQVWLGTLLLWDGVEGPWNAFHLAAP
ncbi:MAG: hypothetical protein ABIP55_09065, partial [Tepidisphaeraceae bacterium]